MKFFISVDLEGMPGVNFWHEVDYQNAQFDKNRQRANHLLKKMCVDLIREFKDVEKITICDSHAFGNNIMIEDFPDCVEIISGFPRKYYMMEGLNEEYDGVFMMGYHCGLAGTGGLDHTYSMKIDQIRINGKLVNEFMINAYFAGHHGVPVVMTSGSREYINEVKGMDENVEVLVTKDDLGKYASRIKSMSGIEKDMTDTLKSIKDMTTYSVHKVDGSLDVEISFCDTIYAEVTSWIPTVERKDGKTIRLKAENILSFYEVLMTIIFVVESASSLK